MKKIYALSLLLSLPSIALSMDMMKSWPTWDIEQNSCNVLPAAEVANVVGCLDSSDEDENAIAASLYRIGEKLAALEKKLIRKNIGGPVDLKKLRENFTSFEDLVEAFMQCVESNVRA